MKSENLAKSAQSQQNRLPCPVCRHPVDIFVDNVSKHPKYFPFCSERCKLIDLGAWLDADYRIPSRLDETSDDPPMDVPAASDSAP